MVAHLGGVTLAALSGLVAGILGHVADPAYSGVGFWSGIALQLVATPILLLARRAPMAVTWPRPSSRCSCSRPGRSRRAPASPSTTASIPGSPWP